MNRLYSYYGSSGNICWSSLLLSSILLLTICSDVSARVPGDKPALVKIAGKIISVNDFFERSEFTIRPAQLKDKNIVLKNLISEKILALEAERDNNALLSNPVFINKIKGIREQSMRDILYNQEASNNIKIDSIEIARFFRNSIREYQLEFYVLNSDSLLIHISNILEKNPQRTNEVFQNLEKSLGKKPLHKTKFLDPDDQILSEALFTTLLDTGAVVGPLKISNGDHIILRVNNWTDYPVIGKEDRQLRWNKISEKLNNIKADRQWKIYVNRVMKDKKIQFHPEYFKLLAEIAFKHYKKINRDTLNIELNEVTVNPAGLNDNSPVFNVDNISWTLHDFKTELMSHPLVYRTKNLNKNNFIRQFEIAVVDMIRDHYLTEECYRRKYDSDESVRNTVELWRDFYLALQQQSEIVNTGINNGTIKENDNRGKIKYWQTYLRTLHKNYEDQIEINYEEYNKIKLTRIDVMAMRSGVPYPLPVPVFPRFIYPEDDESYSIKNQK